MTLPYNSADLSSVACINSLGSGNGSPIKWAPINYNDLYYPIPMSESLARVSRCFTEPSQNGMWGDYMQNPFISIPQDISNVDPAWAPATCTAGFLGAMDPPRALHPAVSMAPVGGPAAAMPESQLVANPSATALPGQPIPAPVVTPTAAPTVITGSSSPESSATDPGKSADPGSDPSNNSAPAGNKPLGAAPHRQNPPANDPAPNQSIPVPSTGDKPPAFQFGSGQGSPDPNNMSPAQLSALHQALQPSQAPAAADPASDPGSNLVGNNVGGSSTGSSPDPQPNASPGAPAGASNNQPVDVQLQSISSAIFNNPAWGSSGGQQDPESAGSGSGRSGSGDSPMNALVNVPQAKDSPQGNDAPQNARPTNAGQGATAGAANQPALFRASNGNLIVGSSTIMPGQAATINSHQVSVGSINVAIDGNTYAFAAPTPSTPTPITVGGLAMQAAPDGGAIIAGSAYTPGARMMTAGHAISVGSGTVVVDGTTQALPSIGPGVAPPVMIGGSPMQRASNGAVVIGGSTLPVGAQTTMAGHFISVGAANVIVDGTTNALPTPAPTPASSPVLIDGQQMQRAPNGGLAIGSITLAPGAQTTIAGHSISVGPSAVFIDSSTHAFPSAAGAVILSTTPSGPQRSVVTLPGGSVLSAGRVATISGQIVSVLPNDQGAVIGGSTIAFAPTSVFTVGDQTFTAAPTGFAVAGTSVTPDGPAVTINGTIVSLGPSGLHIGSSTVLLTSASATGLAGLILSAFAPGATNTAVAGASVTGVTPFTGPGSKLKVELWVVSISFLICTAVGGLAI